MQNQNRWRIAELELNPEVVENLLENQDAVLVRSGSDTNVVVILREFSRTIPGTDRQTLVLFNRNGSWDRDGLCRIAVDGDEFFVTFPDLASAGKSGKFT